MKHIIDSLSLTREELEDLFKLSYGFDSLKHKIMATLFYEPSTRTRLSFESAMIRLGGSVISTENAKESTSHKKNESLEDTIKVVSSYADVIVLRHDYNYASKLASQVSKVPIINAGDGSGEHPTQAMVDLYTILRHFGTLSGLKVAIAGDLLYGRTVHSLVKMLGLWEDNEIICVNHPLAFLPGNVISESKIRVSQVHQLCDACRVADVVYMTRLQTERWDDAKKLFAIQQNPIVMDENCLNLLKKNSIVLHPLPRGNELPCIKHDKIKCFEQAENGVPVRMALLESVVNG